MLSTELAWLSRLPDSDHSVSSRGERALVGRRRQF